MAARIVPLNSDSFVNGNMLANEELSVPADLSRPISSNFDAHIGWIPHSVVDDDMDEFGFKDEFELLKGECTTTECNHPSTVHLGQGNVENIRSSGEFGADIGSATDSHSGGGIRNLSMIATALPSSLDVSVDGKSSFVTQRISIHLPELSFGQQESCTDDDPATSVTERSFMQLPSESGMGFSSARSSEIVEECDECFSIKSTAHSLGILPHSPPLADVPPMSLIAHDDLQISEYTGDGQIHSQQCHPQSFYHHQNHPHHEPNQQSNLPEGQRQVRSATLYDRPTAASTDGLVNGITSLSCNKPHRDISFLPPVNILNEEEGPHMQESSVLSDLKASLSRGNVSNHLLNFLLTPAERISPLGSSQPQPLQNGLHNGVMQ